jgi:integrase
VYGPGEHVACEEGGHPFHPNLICWRLGKLLDALKIPQVRLDDARHSCGTLMRLRGVPIAVIAAWSGHASAAFTMAVYVHSQDEALKRAGTRFGRVVTSCDTETRSEG